MDGSYSTDGTHFTTFYTNSGATSSSNLQVNDFALPGISGATNLYVKFDAKGTSGLVQFFYGGGTLTAPLPTYAAQSGDNPFYLSGTVTPEPAAISLLGMGGVLLLVARRKRA